MKKILSFFLILFFLPAVVLAVPAKKEMFKGFDQFTWETSYEAVNKEKKFEVNILIPQNRNIKISCNILENAYSKNTLPGQPLYFFYEEKLVGGMLFAETMNDKKMIDYLKKNFGEPKFFEGSPIWGTHDLFVTMVERDGKAGTFILDPSYLFLLIDLLDYKF